MNRKATFTKTSRKRAWYQRLTPAAWLVIVVLGVVTLAALASGVEALAGGKDVPFGSEEQVEIVPEPPASPSDEDKDSLPETVDESEDWWDEALPPITNTNTSALPPAMTMTQVWWLEHTTCDDQDRCTLPQEASDEIIAAYWEWKKAIPYYYYELDMTPEQLG